MKKLLFLLFAISLFYYYKNKDINKESSAQDSQNVENKSEVHNLERTGFPQGSVVMPNPTPNVHLRGSVQPGHNLNRPIYPSGGNYRLPHGPDRYRIPPNQVNQYQPPVNQANPDINAAGSNYQQDPEPQAYQPYQEDPQPPYNPEPVQAEPPQNPIDPQGSYSAERLRQEFYRIPPHEREEKIQSVITNHPEIMNNPALINELRSTHFLPENSDPAMPRPIHQQESPINMAQPPDEQPSIPIQEQPTQDQPIEPSPIVDSQPETF